MTITIFFQTVLLKKKTCLCLQWIKYNHFFSVFVWLKYTSDFIWIRNIIIFMYQSMDIPGTHRMSESTWSILLIPRQRDSETTRVACVTITTLCVDIVYVDMYNKYIWKKQSKTFVVSHVAFMLVAFSLHAQSAAEKTASYAAKKTNNGAHIHHGAKKKKYLLTSERKADPSRGLLNNSSPRQISRGSRRRKDGGGRGGRMEE